MRWTMNAAVAAAALWSAGVAAQEATVQLLDGQALAGRLVALDEARAAIRTDGGQLEEVELSRVLNIAFRAEPAPDLPPHPVWVELVDGSQIVAAGYEAAGGRATVRLADAAPATISTSFIRSVRWARQDERLERQWREITAGPLQGDAVIVRRSPASLDHWEGVLHAVGEDNVDFELDGNRVTVPRQRLEGVAYYHPDVNASDEPRCRVLGVRGSVWKAARLSVAEDRAELTTTAGAAFRLPLDALTAIDFSASNLVYLSDLEPESVRWSPYFPSRVAAERLEQLFRPRRDESLLGGPLQLGGRSYAKGLAMHSRTELTYRLTAPYRRFQAVAGIDDRVRDGGHVRLTISDGQRTLLDEILTGRSEPLQIDLDISNVRRLVILVDFAEQLDIADHLDLAEARLMR